MKHFLIFLLFTFTISSVSAQKNTNQRAQWFTDSRFGMFIHWGVYSGAEGYWKGEKLRNDNDYAEWIFYRNQIEKDEYVGLLDKFDWDKIDPEKWVILAKNSGMKYLTITAKHHDGFALWDSRIGNYNIGEYTSPKRDIIKELAEACKKHGLKLGLYYSHWVDWEHEQGWNHNREIYGITPDEYDIYWQEKVIPQVRELVSNYGEISMMWFDMWIHHSSTIVSKQQLLQLKSLIRELQPNCLVNSRLGLSIKEDADIDFKTLGDNQLGNKKEDFPWQSPATVAHSWGFHSSDSQWKSTSTLLKSLIGNVSLNGNFMLNIGPRANGDVPYEIEQRMLEMGNWLQTNGEAIYGAEAFDLDKNQHDWGKITCKASENSFKIYLHVYNWPLNNKLNVSGILNSPQKVYLLADKTQTPIEFNFNDAFTEIQLPVEQPDHYISLVVLEFDKKPAIKENLAGKTVDDGFSLTPENSKKSLKEFDVESKQRRGTIPSHINVKTENKIEWEIYVDEPGEKNIDLSYSAQGKKSKIEITAGNQTLESMIPASGKTVGEPNQDWVIDRFASKRIGKIVFPEKGLYTISAKVLPGEKEEFKFQWIWIK